MNTTFHYPPEVMALLIDTIPLLCRSYEDTPLLFQGAGVKAKRRSKPFSVHRKTSSRTFTAFVPIAELDGDEIGYLVAKVVEIKRQR